MEDLERKQIFDKLQELMDRCILSTYKVYANGIYRKREFLGVS